MDVDEFLRGLDEPPEVMRSMTAFLADRARLRPGDLGRRPGARGARHRRRDARRARSSPSTRPHVLEACVRTMFGYDPIGTLAAVAAPVVALVAAASGDDAPGAREPGAGRRRARRGWRPVAGRSAAVSFGHDGHNLMRYRPDAVSAAILSVAGAPTWTQES